MLSAELVRARRRADRLILVTLKGDEREEAERISADILAVLSASEGQTLDDVTESLATVERDARSEKIWAGLKKLALDACVFGNQYGVDAPLLRKDVFELASRQRRESSAETPFSRDKVLQAVARKHNLQPADVPEGMFSDLRGAARLTQGPHLDPGGLVELYEMAQIQGVLLRAVQLSVVVSCENPEQARWFFQKLKFRQLLYRLEEISPGKYRVEIEGPFSLFESVTKYGLSLALLVPDLLGFSEAKISADVRWGKERRPLQFEATLQGRGGESASFPARDDVQALLTSLGEKKSPFSASPSREIFDIPGVGLCIPDVKLSAAGRQDVYVEVLGFWSRDAVWRRIEWARSNTQVKVVFAVSSRLRVKKEVLGEETGAALYVYKTSMNASALLAQVEELSASV
jgi:uncharacterized protein